MRDICVVFDLDGTLVDSSADLIDAANAALVELGHAPALHHPQDAAVAFRGGKAMLELGARRLAHGDAPALVAAGYPLLLAAYARQIDRHTCIYDGVIPVLEDLRKAGYATAICTNKPEALARDLVARLGLAPFFDALIGADTLPTRKPDPAPFHAAVALAGGARRACLIGDTITDRDCARAAGVPVILVTFGPEGRAVADLGPDGLLDHYRDLPALVAQVFAARS